jgi:hypothetical protein
MTATQLLPFDFGRIVNAIQKVEERLERATAALDAAGVPYAVIGGNAVAQWVSRVNEAAVRFTKDVDLLLKRSDLAAAAAALAPAGFRHRHAAGIDFFLDGTDGRFEDAVHVVFAGEKVRSEYVADAPEVTESVRSTRYQVLDLESLVRMKLTSYRLKDQVHLQDFVHVGLIDRTWPARFSPELGQRLQRILDNPDG